MKIPFVHRYQDDDEDDVLFRPDPVIQPRTRPAGPTPVSAPFSASAPARIHLDAAEVEALGPTPVSAPSSASAPAHFELDAAEVEALKSRKARVRELLSHTAPSSPSSREIPARNAALGPPASSSEGSGRIHLSLADEQQEAIRWIHRATVPTNMDAATAFAGFVGSAMLRTQGQHDFFQDDASGLQCSPTFHQNALQERHVCGLPLFAVAVDAVLRTNERLFAVVQQTVGAAPSPAKLSTDAALACARGHIMESANGGIYLKSPDFCSVYTGVAQDFRSRDATFGIRQPAAKRRPPTAAQH
ncbi:hypothetical protein OC835_001372 [Tilletia horrida]|nr:hypothetical protein OC835_001372 [Tilletia horrida]